MSIEQLHKPMIIIYLCDSRGATYTINAIGLLAYLYNKFNALKGCPFLYGAMYFVVSYIMIGTVQLTTAMVSM